MKTRKEEPGWGGEKEPGGRKGGREGKTKEGGEEKGKTGGKGRPHSQGGPGLRAVHRLLTVGLL